MRPMPPSDQKTMSEEWKNFIYALSHDLQEPVSKIIMISEFLSDKAKTLEKEDREYIDRLCSNGKRIKKLSEDMVSYWKLADAPPFRESFHVKKIWEEAYQDTKAILTESDAKVFIDGDAVIQADRIQWKKAFAHLLDNAVRFAKDNTKPEVHVRITPMRNAVQIIIKDNGVGFDPKYAVHIFEPFKTCHAKSKYGGNGLGLSIVLKIVQNHHANISAESVPGEGSTFTLTVPNV